MKLMVTYSHELLESVDNSHVNCVSEVDKEDDEGDEVEVQGAIKWRRVRRLMKLRSW